MPKAQASESARTSRRNTQNGQVICPVHFRTLLAHLGTRCRNSCVVAGDPKQTKLFPGDRRRRLQAKALRLIKMCQKPELDFDISSSLLSGFPTFDPGTSD